jgi:glycosyltransferase involved in cell wall biosynthesis
MAMGVPVVATRISGIPEVVLHHQNGLLVAAEDPAAMADAVQLLIDAPALGAQLGREARRTVTTNFDNDHNLRVVLGLLEAGHVHDEAPCAVA